MESASFLGLARLIVLLSICVISAVSGYNLPRERPATVPDVARALVSLSVILLLSVFATGLLARSTLFSFAMRKAPHEFCSHAYTVAACVTIPFLVASWTATSGSGFRSARHIFWGCVHLGFVYLANATGNLPSIAQGEEASNRFFMHHQLLTPIFLAVYLAYVALRVYEINLWNAEAVATNASDVLTRDEDSSNPYEAPLEE